LAAPKINRFVEPAARVRVSEAHVGEEDSSMSQTRPLHVIVVLAAFLFVGAIVLNLI
jgi:hypothetical protein